MGVLCDLIVDESLRTIVALATTAIIGGIVWLVTLRIRSQTIRSLLSNPRRPFDLYYRGDSAPEHNKRIYFKEDGSIGDGNNNENRWGVKFGVLELYASSGAVYSKFRWDKTTGKLQHVNDPTLPSVMGQYIVPLFIPPDA